MLKPSDKTQNTMIVIWLLELFLNQLGELRDSDKQSTQEYSKLVSEMDEFFKRPSVMVRNYIRGDMVSPLLLEKEELISSRWSVVTPLS